MQRFYCSICKRVKRVQQLPPVNITHEDGEINPARRIGQCRWHSAPRIGSHAEFLNHKRRPHINVKKKKGQQAQPKPAKKQQRRNEEAA